MKHSKKFKCSFCIYQSDRAYNLKIHQRKKHTDVQQGIYQELSTNKNLNQFKSNEIDRKQHDIIPNELQNLKRILLISNRNVINLIKKLNTLSKKGCYILNIHD